MIRAEKVDGGNNTRDIAAYNGQEGRVYVASTSAFNVQRCSSNPLNIMHQAEPTEG